MIDLPARDWRWGVELRLQSCTGPSQGVYRDCENMTGSTSGTIGLRKEGREGEGRRRGEIRGGRTDERWILMMFSLRQDIWWREMEEKES